MHTQLDQAVKIGKLEEKLEGLRAQQSAHAAETRGAIGDLSKKVDSLFEVMNKGKGAFTMALIVSGAVGAFVAKIFSMIMGKSTLP